MSDEIRWPPGTRSHHGATLPGQVGIDGFGHYEEIYCQLDGGRWMLQHIHLVRARVGPIVDRAD
jgi:hypothetical protein